MEKIKMHEKLKCKRCNHLWTPRHSEIYSCPLCHSPKWNVEK